MSAHPSLVITPLDEALQAYREADYRVRQAQAERDAALESVLNQVPDRAEEGTTRCDTQFFKASITNKLNRSLDKPAVAEFKNSDPDIYALLFDEEPSLNLRALRALEMANPTAYAQAERLFVLKPGKPSLKVEILQ